MSRVPSKPFHGSGEGVPDIPPTEFAQLRQRVNVLETNVQVLSSAMASYQGQLNVISLNARRREFAFNASPAISLIGGNYWKICGAYRCFESLTLEFVRGASPIWPVGSQWQIVALRTNGQEEVQNVGDFVFDFVPAINLEFQSGDVLSILVRNFDPQVSLDLDDNPAVCTMVFLRN